MDYPFIFISSLIRSGSTLVQELLTQLPYSFIFHEPKLFDNRFNTRAKHLKGILKYGININRILKPPTLSKFKTEVMPLLKDHIMQVGVKEVGNKNWKNYIDAFPDTKVILTGRDPRDLYISVFYWKNRAGNLDRVPKKTIRILTQQMKRQIVIYQNCSAMKVKYEDLCNNKKRSITEIKSFVNSPIPTSGKVGGFLSAVPKRRREYVQHKNKITTSSIGRWNQENEKLVKLANNFFDSVPEYCNFWGYKK